MSQSAAPSTTPAATASPAVQPTTTIATPIVLAADSIAEVVSGPLRVRSRPRIAEDSIKFDPLLPSGERLFVIDGPVRASEYDWYLVVPLDTWTASVNIGWVAAADHDGTPWLRSEDAACPADPTLFEVTAMQYLDALSCYRTRAFTFTDVLYMVGCGDGGYLASPGWMCGRYSWGEPDYSGPKLALPPDLVPAEFASGQSAQLTLTITARLDDPAARTCTAATYPEIEVDYELLSARVVLDCRATFVASSVLPAT